jgi:hypothetical protein
MLDSQEGEEGKQPNNDRDLIAFHSLKLTQVGPPLSPGSRSLVRGCAVRPTFPYRSVVAAIYRHQEAGDNGLICPRDLMLVKCLALRPFNPSQYPDKYKRIFSLLLQAFAL